MKILYTLCFSLVAFLVLNATNPDTEQLIIWDASLSMESSDKNAIISGFQGFFEEQPNVNVRLVVFSNQIISDEQFSVNNGNWASLESKMTTIVYDGKTNFDCIKPLINQFPNHLLITDDPNYSNWGLSLSNSNINSGTVNSLQSTVRKDNKENSSLSGRVFLNGYPVEAEISIKDSSAKKIVTSDKDGNFKIVAEVGDVLVINYNKETLEEHIFSLSDQILVFFNKDVELLDQVDLKYVKKSNMMFNQNQKLFGPISSLNKRSLAVASQTVKNEQFMKAAVTLRQGIAYKLFPRSNALGGYDYNFTGALVIVDGVRFDNDILDILMPHEIHEVTLIRGTGPAFFGNRGGSLNPGRNGNTNLPSDMTSGTLLVTTKAAFSRLPIDKYPDSKIFDKRLIKKPKYKTYSRYVNKDNFSYSDYLNNREKHKDDVAFYMAMFDHFKSKDFGIAQRILSNINELYANNIGVLRALAFKYESSFMPQKAIVVYKQIVEAYPRDLQGYFDLASLYKKQGNYKAANSFLKRLATLDIDKDSKFSDDYQDFLLHEISALRTEARNKGIEPFSNAPKTELDETTYNNRVVVRWNNRDAEFILQFVSPNNRYENWTHTLTMDHEDFKFENEYGFYSKEFIMDGNLEDINGDWLLNIEDFGSGNTDVPNMFFITVYKNYGKPYQTSKSQLYIPNSKKNNTNALAFMN